MVQNSKFKIQNSRKGFTLIELLVAILIFSLIVVAIVSVFVSTVTSSGKARAVKNVKENAEFAVSSIAKDVRMGKIESTDSNCIGTGTSPKSCLMITRNGGGKVCYKVASDYLGIQESVSGN
ncbi:MAG: type II secretion system protein, partial [Candidatus Moranbacteria bacterium]|nr:type II secretion system protein [Candidatus Moranbacteria bacterium]